MPMKYRLFRLNNRLDDNITDKNRFASVPSLNFSYKLNSSHHRKASAMLNYMTPSIETLYSGHILTSYRQLSALRCGRGLYEGYGSALLFRIWLQKYSFNELCRSGGFLERFQWPEVALRFHKYFALGWSTYHQQTYKETGGNHSAKIHTSQGFGLAATDNRSLGYILLLRQSVARSGTRVLRYYEAAA